MKSAKAIVSSKGQVVIPQSMRKALGIHSGTELVFTLHGQVLEATPIKKHITAFFGCCKEEQEPPTTISEMDEIIQRIVLEDEPKRK